jgi:4-amino-4-deoxy-L-arabinose transferase-like glycosyltransferase
MKRPRLFLLFLVLLFSLLFIMRFVHLAADPPPDLSSSMGYMGDPGGYNINARNKIVFGTWEMDMWNNMYISPLPHYFSYLIFLILGPGIAQMNLVPVIFGCLTLILVYLVFRKNHSAALALLGVFLLGTNYQFTMFSRIAVRVMPLLFFTMLALFFLAGRRRPSLGAFLAGASCVVAFTVKATFAQILPSILAGLFFYALFRERPSLKRALVQIGWFALGAALVCAVWLPVIYLPHTDIINAYGGENIDWLTPPKDLGQMLKNFWLRPLFFFNHMPVMTSLASLYLLMLAFRAFSRPQRVTLLNWICGFWMISNMLYYSVIYYHAARHFVVLVLPLVVLAANFLFELLKLKHTTTPEKIPLLFYPFLFIWLVFPLSHLVILVFGRPTEPAVMESRFFLVLAVSGAVCLLLAAVHRLGPRNRTVTPLPRVLVASGVALALVLSTGYNLRPYVRWASAARADIRDISRDLGRDTSVSSVAGLMSLILSLENQNEAHPYRRGYINPYRDFMERFRITHVFVTLHAGGIERIEYEQDFPEAMGKARLTARFPLAETHAELYALTPHAGPGTEGEVKDYEGETFFGRNGIPRFDPDASRNWAFVAEKAGAGFLIELPGVALPQGSFEAAVRLKMEDSPSGEGRIMKIDLADPRRRRVMGTGNLTAPELRPAGSYREFTFTFTVPREGEYAFRIHSTGETILWIDRIRVRPLPAARPAD